MATATHRNLKNGQLVYDIQAYVNGKFKSMSWRVPKGLSKAEIERTIKKLQADFDLKVRETPTEFKDNLTFSEYAESWLKDCKRENSPTSYHRNTKIVADVNRFIGDIPLQQLKPMHIKKILDYLNDKIVVKTTAILKKPLDNIIKEMKIRKISKDSGFSFTTFLYARRNCPILWENAVKLCQTLNINVNEYFTKITKATLYAKGSKDKYKRVINAILNKAVRLELLDRNPAKKVFVKNAITGEDKEKEILTLEETEMFETALLNITTPSRLREKTAIALLFYQAMRIGEVAGLEWKHIDFEKNSIHIVQSSIYINPQLGIITKDPKSKTSKRTIRMPNVMANILKEYKVWYDNEKQRHGSAWKNKDRVICRPDGEIITPSTIRLWLTKLLEENNIRKVSPHSLRHTNITLQMRSKIPAKAIAKFAGHSDASVTLNVYSHFLEEDEDDYAHLFDNLFKKKA